MYDEKQMKKGTQALYPVAAEKIKVPSLLKKLFKGY